MVDDELRSKLTGLHQMLTASPTLDGESRTLLRTVLQDIEQVLKGPGEAIGTVAHAEPGTPDAAMSPVDRLETLATRFEADHPAITGVLRQLTDLLAKAGI
jgi:hypothetical protein